VGRALFVSANKILDTAGYERIIIESIGVGQRSWHTWNSTYYCRCTNSRTGQ